ncbi:hypothetical protein FB561_5135 [Kribbella amoyensis]|uniref:Uncharacterized protein n=1 Tax=Kribbella amoyensis TaxID=996641 RepID=A0A561BYJ1_9ACTN|nr:hypothetical protein [Kribbella amoyensis]TWD83964.1 hypothetical protein FB561_5135 [Kribbella amoyensis]
MTPNSKGIPDMLRELPRREQLGPWLLLLGTTLGGLGMVWDVQWHSDVGPDTFFTAPHLLLYLGMATSGITSLVIVLLNTRASHTSQYVDGSPAVTVLGTFRAPLPYLLCGCAGAGGLLFGLADLWWHEVYGFDVTPTSPPHVAMSLMSLFDTAGLLLAFILLRSTRAGRLGLTIAIGACVPNLVFLLYSTPPIPGIATVVLAISAAGVLLLSVFAGALRRPALVASVAPGLILIHAALWFFAPAATRIYADSLGLGLRDYALGVPAMPITLPFALPLAALLYAGGLRLGRARGWSPKVVIPVLGALGTTLVVAGYLSVPLGTTPLTLLPAAPIGAVAGWIGWQLGSLGRIAGAGLTTEPPIAQPGRTASRLLTSEA